MHQQDSVELPRLKGLTLLTPMSLLTCRMVVGGEHDGTVAVFPHDGATKDERV